MIVSARSLYFIVIQSLFAVACTSKSNNGPVLPQKVEWSIDNGTLQSAETISFIRVNGSNNIYAT